MMKEKMIYSVLRSPISTEKSAKASALSKYVFKVSRESTKPMIKRAVEFLFKTKVLSVNIINVPGKTKTFKRVKGRASGYKKAVVTVKKGEVLELQGK